VDLVSRFLSLQRQKVHKVHSLSPSGVSSPITPDEAIDVMRLLWAGGEDGVSFHGEFFAFDNLCSFPKPHGASTLPNHIGGSSQAAARRAGRHGDGYFPGGIVVGATATEPDQQRDEMSGVRPAVRPQRCVTVSAQHSGLRG
jgi:alkanesulfonate monooxygenase SsuD/methylene tetrahydromethanopterin reductase-like flavin-dependent oxidoreductase (luciferase family)